MVLARFDQQRRHIDRIRRLRLGQIAENLLTDQRVQQLLQPFALRWVGENQLAQGGAIELAVALQHARAEALDDAGQGRATRFDNPARRLVGIDQVHTKLDEALGSGTLAATNAAGQAENPGGKGRSGHQNPSSCMYEAYISSPQSTAIHPAIAR
ncbi:hypothetical protein D9M71_405340 [compost metagenome]